MLQDSMESNQKKQRHQDGVNRAKHYGKYAGRKKIAVDQNLFRQVRLAAKTVAEVWVPKYPTPQREFWPRATPQRTFWPQADATASLGALRRALAAAGAAALGWGARVARAQGTPVVHLRGRAPPDLLGLCGLGL